MKLDYLKVTVLFFVLAVPCYAQNPNVAEVYADSLSLPCEQSEAKYVSYIPQNEQGQYHGEATTFFVQNGKKIDKISAKVEWVKGLKEGKITEYYLDGQKRLEGKFVQNKPSGIWTDWLENNKGRQESELSFNTSPTDIATPYLRKVINFWDSTGVQTLQNGTGRYYNITHLSHHFIEQGEFKDSKKVGSWVGKYTSGKPYYEEKWEDGNLIEGKSYDEAGKEYTYTVHNQPPQYATGQRGMANYLRSQFKYPKEAMRVSIEGTVYVMFWVNKGNQVTKARIMKGAKDLDEKALEYANTYYDSKKHKNRKEYIKSSTETFKKNYPFLEAEALRLIQGMQDWQAGTLRGQPVDQFMILPIKFKLP